MEPVSTNTGAWAPASSRVLAEELMSRSGCSEKSQRVQIKQKCQSSSPTMPGNQRWILREERAGKMMPFVCNSNTMNQQITCKMLLMKMCIMDVHNQRRWGEGGSGARLCCWDLKVVWSSSDGSDVSIKSSPGRAWKWKVSVFAGEKEVLVKEELLWSGQVFGKNSKRGSKR